MHRALIVLLATAMASLSVNAEQLRVSLDWSVMPPAQKALVEVVTTARTAFNTASNELVAGAQRVNRAEAICHLMRDMKSGDQDDWLGVVELMQSANNGHGVLRLAIGPDIWVTTRNTQLGDALSGNITLIDPRSPIYQDLARLKRGDVVKFTAMFLKDRDDCIAEESLTQAGSMRRPTFIARFVGIKPAARD